MNPDQNNNKLAWVCKNSLASGLLKRHLSL
jgi:hypothetical protein